MYVFVCVWCWCAIYLTLLFFEIPPPNLKTDTWYNVCHGNHLKQTDQSDSSLVNASPFSWPTQFFSFVSTYQFLCVVISFCLNCYTYEHSCGTDFNYFPFFLCFIYEVWMLAVFNAATKTLFSYISFSNDFLMDILCKNPKRNSSPLKFVIIHLFCSKLLYNVHHILSPLMAL